MSNLRILVLTPALTPYRLALFNAIQRSGGCKLFVLALTHREPNRLWNIDLEELAFEYRVLEGTHLRRDVEAGSGRLARHTPGPCASWLRRR